MVLIDTPLNGYSHMVATTVKELHEFANSISVNKCWYSNKKGKKQPHYDVKIQFYQLAIVKGAKLVKRKELFEFLKENYGV